MIIYENGNRSAQLAGELEVKARAITEDMNAIFQEVDADIRMRIWRRTYDHCITVALGNETSVGCIR